MAEMKKNQGGRGTKKPKVKGLELDSYLDAAHRFLHGQGRPCSMEDVYQYLCNPEGIALTRDKKTVVNWMTAIHKQRNHPFRTRIRLRHPTPKERRERGYQETAWLAESIAAPLDDRASRAVEGQGAVPKGELPAEGAWLLRLAEQILQDVIPEDYHDHALHDLFAVANKRLGEHPDLKLLARRIVYRPRGQRLHESEETQARRREAVGEIMDAIRLRRMLAFVYKGEDGEHQVHPVALVYREPKMYLLAMRDDEQKPRQYLCARMTDVGVMDRPSRIPDDYEIGDVDVSLHRKYGLGPKPVRLVLRIKGGRDDNLVDDLGRYMLDPHQVIRQEPDGDWLLTVPKIKVTAQLMQWLGALGRAVRIEEPEALRDAVS